MKFAYLQDVHVDFPPFFFFIAVSKLLADKIQNIFSLKSVLTGFIKYILNKKKLNNINQQHIFFYKNKRINIIKHTDAKEYICHPQKDCITLAVTDNSFAMGDRIYSHPQTDSFVLSELFSMARHAGRSKPGSKPVQLYVRLSFRPLGHQVDHVG